MSNFERWFLPLIAIFLLLAVFVKEVAAQPTISDVQVWSYHLTSDPLDPKGTSVIITVDGVDDPTCGPGAASCIGENGAIWFDLSALVLFGKPFTVTARLCNGVDNCSTSPEPKTFDPATFRPHPPTGITIIEL